MQRIMMIIGREAFTGLHSALAAVAFKVRMVDNVACRRSWELRSAAKRGEVAASSHLEPASRTAPARAETLSGREHLWSPGR